MQIAHITLHPIATRRRTGIANQHVVVQVETDDGYAGWGEMSDLSHVPMYQFDLPELERMLNELCRGRDPRNLSALEDALIKFFPDEGHMYSRSGLVRQGMDLALHDLLGRRDGVPVYELLGGALRTRMRVCYPIFRMRAVKEVEPNLQRVEAMQAQGFDLIRLYVGANQAADVAFLQGFAARFDTRVAIKSWDFSNLLDWRRAVMAIEELRRWGDCLLIESPAPRYDLAGLAEVRARSHRPVSEHALNLHHAWQLLTHKAVDILNVSPYVLGGLRACERVIAVAESARASVLIGTTQELHLGTAAVAHLAAAARVLDYPGDSTGPLLYEQDVASRGVTYDGSYLVTPETPGLGVEIDAARLAALSSAAAWTFGVDLAGALDRTPASRPSASA